MEVQTEEDFQCPVCLDLIYKPVVLECGHVSCFWCVHKSMSGLRESSCAVCRRPYIYFPGICQLFHNLLLKLEPAAYKKRGAEVLEEEERSQCFSPQVVENLEDEEQKKETRVCISDVLCSGCSDLLFRPAVLNCGHVFCEACSSGLASEKLKCPTCGDSHPGQLPTICLVLDHFLKSEFPDEYAKRRDSFIMSEEKKNQCNGTSSSGVLSDKICSKMLIQSKKIHLQRENGFSIDVESLDVHVGVGCDACGMYPISGKRYKCRDCKESVGFDLCEACYDTPSKRPGRFNQQHTPDHKLELDDSHLLLNILKEHLKHELSDTTYDEFTSD